MTTNNPQTTMPSAVLSLPLASDCASTSANVSTTISTITGPHRFVTINGKNGYQALSQKTTLKLDTNVHASERGAINLWLAPTESLGVSPAIQHIDVQDPTWQDYGLITDAAPTNNIADTVFAWYWRSFWHPQMIAKFMHGVAGNAAADFAITPYVPVEHMPLHEREWYQLTFTWDKPASRFRIYVNGILCGTTRYPFQCETPNPVLYIGNAAMVFADIDFFDVELSAEQIAANYAASSAPKNPVVEEELLQLFTAQPKAAVDWAPDDKWTLQYERTLTKAGDFDGWSQQGCTTAQYPLKALEISAEGLLIQTPDAVNTETRVYFWSPDIFEGDLAVEYEFRPEQDTGLALLIVQATGMQREDYLTDHPKRSSGAMSTIIADRVRNYHWEYFRHAVDVRNDIGSQVIVKNPWQRPLAMSAIPVIAKDQWHKLLFVQEGRRLRGAIDGEWVFDVVDDPFNGTGPILNSGRIGLRLMYNSCLRFKNLKVWNNNPIKLV